MSRVENSGKHPNGTTDWSRVNERQHLLPSPKQPLISLSSCNSLQQNDDYDPQPVLTHRNIISTQESAMDSSRPSHVVQNQYFKLFSSDFLNYSCTKCSSSTLMRNILNQSILVLFTCGFISSVIGFVSLDTTGSDQKIFQTFYPLGSILMMSIFGLQPEKMPQIISEKRVKYSICLILSFICLMVTLAVLKWDFEETSIIILTIILYMSQLTISFYYAFTSISQLSYN